MIKPLKLIVSMIHLVLYAVLFFCLSGCMAVPVGSENVTDEAKYLQVNKYVSHHLDEEFFEVFPAEFMDGTACERYEYSYNCALLGEPSFSIRLKLRFDESVNYFEEKGRLEEKAGCEADVLVFLGDSKYIEAYLDDTAEDGRICRCLLAVTDDARQTVDYYYGELQDSAEKDPWLRDVLR